MADDITDTDATSAVIAGPDEHALGEELAELGVPVSRIEGVVSADALETAGIADVDLLVLTDVEEATAIPVAKELNPSVTVVTYSERSLPEFVAAVADLAIDPELLSPVVVAEELSSTGGD
ncbi:Trk K+ transport system NAD-binding subunit [Halorubrum alkaliphilum]|uniref:Trk K+ transport system NAD-binding subunit n=1 Tax=Halorubrum alkaliphilum TaxID=261290 RepID=A0A8T4GCG3_9EURY|nr:CTP synthetase [Halorubrum alkaliphilum]MBP1921793.1 Trk K+ transport system NAD-binding subunit [Halorubrum alkaliphilum]